MITSRKRRFFDIDSKVERSDQQKRQIGAAAEGEQQPERDQQSTQAHGGGAFQIGLPAQIVKDKREKQNKKLT